jgi:hypothetical protein
MNMNIRGVVLASISALAIAAATPSVAHAYPIPPRGEMDCNGFSILQQKIARTLPCADLRGPDGRGEDNGHYIGHDEPSVGFYSTSPRSGYDMQWVIMLPVDGPLPATQTYENQIAFWLGLALCVPDSYPQNPCTPDSDSNRSGINDPSDAGSGFLEMQFYPPGHPPFVQFTSCDATSWCAALNAFSLECNFGFSFCNPTCEEPDNFAFIQTDGVPTGPPGPANATLATFTPNGRTLFMRGGDVLRITIKDTPSGMINKIDDLSTGKSGFMIASAANGFQSLNLHTCAPTAFSYHPEFATAKFGNFMPWTTDQVNVNIAVETGHFEASPGDHDPDDTNCFTHALVPGCLGADLDFDGQPYRRTWPDGTSRHPTPVTIGSTLNNGAGPVSGHSGHYIFPYSSMQLETNVGGAEQTCKPNGSGCVVPPPGARFYPFYAVSANAGCVMTFGNDIAGSTTNDFGKDHQYAAPNLAWFFGTLTSGEISNPCTPHV